MQPNIQPQTVQPTPPSDEIGIKDLIREFRLWKSLIRKNWHWLLLAGLVGGSLGFLYASLSKPEYVAKTRFMLKNEGVGSLFGSQMSSLSGLLGGGQMGTPLERTAEVIASDRIIGRALLKEMTIGDTTDLVINHFIRLTNLRKDWKKDTLIKDVQFERKDYVIESLTIPQRKAFKLVKNMMVPEKGKGVVQKSYDKKSGILTFSCTHRSEAFAIGLSKVIYEELNQFFVEQMTYSSTNNASVMKRKVDSIQGQLNYVRRAFAQQTDQSLGLLLQQDKVDLKSLAVKEQMLTVMYGEALKNYETFQFMNSAAMPSLTLIDSPYSPIKPVRKSRAVYSLILSLVFIFMVIPYLRLRLYLNVLSY